MKLTLIVSSIFLIVMVTWITYLKSLVEIPDPPNPKDLKIYNNLAQEYFSKYQPIQEIGFNKTDVKSINMKIDTKKMLLADIDPIKSQLLQNHWRIVQETQYYFEFCYGENIRLSILFPTAPPQTTFSKQKPVATGFSQWTIDNYYNQYGIEDCKMQN